MPTPIVVALAVTLVALLAHAWFYRFLTDDAFISFRYARNLSLGNGLVFNPGGERVEGYTNLLWVLILALFDRGGLPPERVAMPLGFLLTLLLGFLVGQAAWRSRSSRSLWLVVVPTLFLAATRSVAVWSTSGLETRLFEVLAFAGVTRQVLELDAARTGDRRRFVLAPWCFALASLTRPDGILIAGSVFVAAFLLLWRRRPSGVPEFVKGWVPFGLLIGGHLAFRLWYYHQWVPNTYYAKVGGRMMWGSGLRYLAAFVLEYGVWLWLPLLAWAVLRHRARGTTSLLVLYAAAILPHAVYVIAIGGDHFEYRPFDLYFPLVFLLLYAGAQALAARGVKVYVLAGYLGLLLAGLVTIPAASHRQFPDFYITGFPGLAMSREQAAVDFLDPDRDAILRLPGVNQVAGLHRQLLRELSGKFVGLRQEEHRMFLATAIEEGNRFRDLVREGRLPSDVRLATDCVGAIPYVSGVWTLDRLGLTDAHVAHSAFIRDLMAHGKSATIDYARDRWVDLWPVDPVHSFVPYTSVRLIAAVLAARDSVARGRKDTSRPIDRTYAADAGDGYLLFCALPMGIERARDRMPRLEFRPIADPGFFRSFVFHCLAACRDSLRADPGNSGMQYRANYLAAVASKLPPVDQDPGR